MIQTNFLAPAIFTLFTGFCTASWCSVDHHPSGVHGSLFISQKNVSRAEECVVPAERPLSSPALFSAAAGSIRRNRQPAERMGEEEFSGLLFAICTSERRDPAFLNSVYSLPAIPYSEAMEILKTAYGAQQQASKRRITASTTVFDRLLAEEVTSQQQHAVQQEDQEKLIEVGTITKQTPTVSELLLAHDELKTTAWEILTDSKNQNKEYTTILPGTKIYLDQKTGALSWSGQGSSSLVAASVASPAQSINTPGAEPGEQISLGVIDRKTPTVSHLLHNNPRFHDQTWEILSQPINADKAFHKMAAGSEVVLNPTTMEITWNNAKQTAYPVEQLAVTETRDETRLPDTLPNAFLSADLSQAVQPYMGKSYQEVNCYELLVNGLKQLDIPYGGRNGLYSRLTRMALDRGLPPNAYLNGEGIVEIAGATVLTKNYAALDDWQQDSTRLVNEIKPLLNSGQILSFSTQTRGHTGIISRQNEEWTFINSGRLDNAVEKHALQKGVGEELLDNEIHNWFKLAHARGESLKITLGELSQEKLRTIANVGRLTDNRI